jgi:hypothetical protein
VIFIVSWDGPSEEEPGRGNEVSINTVAELDDVLDRVTRQATDEQLPYGVQVHQPGRNGAVMLGIGHPERAFLDWLDRSEPYGRANRYAVEPGVSPTSEPIGFDIYGDWSERYPERTRVTPAGVREAAREYVRTGTQPTNVSWTTGAP